MQKAMTEGEIEAVLREVTDEEVAFYREYGWVMMKQLVTPEFAKELLRVGKEWGQRWVSAGSSFSSICGLRVHSVGYDSDVASCPLNLSAWRQRVWLPSTALGGAAGRYGEEASSARARRLLRRSV